MKRALVLVAGLAGVVGSVVLGVATPASAHNGIGAAFKGPAGPYTVYAYDGYPIPSGQLEYRLIVIDRVTGEPVEDLAATVTARPLDGALAPSQASVTVLANIVLYDLPNPYPDHWWVTVTLRSRLGRGSTSFSMHGSAPYVPADVQIVSVGSDARGAAIGAAAGAVAVCGGAWGWVVYR